MFAPPFIFLLMFLAVITQVFVGSYGFFLPVAGYVTFYLAVTYGWQVGIIVAVIQGVSIDAIYLRHWPFSVIALSAVTGLALIWLWRADSKSLWAKVFPGCLIAVICTLPPTIGNLIRGGLIPDEWLCESMSWLFTMMISGVLLPLLIFLIDDLAERLGLPDFEQARENFIHSSR